MQKTTIIAEIGVNHNGDLALAKTLINAAKQAGADAVKFQHFRADDLVTTHTKMADYQSQNMPDTQTQYELLKALELSDLDMKSLKETCEQCGIEMLVTPFSLRAFDALYELGLRRFKISSGDLSDGPLLLAIAQKQCQVILSTGMGTLSDIEKALSVLAFGYTQQGLPTEQALWQAYSSDAGFNALREKVSVLHCTSEYPTPFDQVNLNMLSTLKQTFGLNIGLSDHTTGINISLAGVALGANIIEKHFTLDKTLPGPDHLASIDVEELIQLVEGVRQIECALGQSQKRIQPCEMKTRGLVRKAIIAARPISKGESFSIENITCKRNSAGLNPMQYWQLLNKPAKADFSVDEPVYE